ncbi:MAG: transglycosylase SLT domain-containing protein [Proteobacteria bacterium]|nr:transglycosylase SLT domain-containing protein [Pseudomonadota bacterium]
MRANWNNKFTLKTKFWFWTCVELQGFTGNRIYRPKFKGEFESYRPLLAVRMLVASSFIIPFHGVYAQSESGSTPPGRIVATETFPEVVHEALLERELSEISTRETLLDAKPEVQATSQERAVVAFLKGIELTKKKEHKEAGKYFEMSLRELPKDSQLFPVVKMSLETLHLDSAKPLNALKSVKSITAKYPSFVEWKSEQFQFMIRVLMSAKSDNLLLKTWLEYLDKVRPAQRSLELEVEVAQFADKYIKIRTKDYYEFLESIAAYYPYTETSRWAFQKLQNLNCGRTKDKKIKDGMLVYRPSLWLLGRLAGNAALDEGLRVFVVQMLNQPVKGSRGETKVFDTAEKINFMMQSRLYSEALDASKAYFEDVSEFKSPTQRPIRAKALYQLGQIHMRLNQWEQSAVIFSRYLQEYGDLYERSGAEEALADSLVRLNFHSEAAKIYAKLGQSVNADPMIRWHHFWNVYLGKDYASALALLEKPGYVPNRDRGIDGGLEYWRAKILEKMGQLDQSNDQFKKILVANGDSFYSLMVQASKPSLREASVPVTPIPSESKRFFDGDQFMAGPSGKKMAAKLLTMPSAVPLTSVAAEVNSVDLKMSRYLQKWGHYRYARRLLKTINWTRVIEGKFFTELADLAFSLGDFAIGLKVAALPQSPFKSMPTSSKDLIEHMHMNNSDWKLMYPFAHERLVTKYADAARIDPYLILSIMRAESVYDPDARSHVGAQGLMQIMPFTAIRIARIMNDQKFDLHKLHTPEVNIGYASFYLRRLLDYYDGNVILAIAAYNAGPNSVDKWLSAYGFIDMDEFVECIPFKETRRYVKSVLRNMNQYQSVYSAKPALITLPKIPLVKSELEIF